MTPEIRNSIKYAALALVAFLLGCAAALVPQLMDPTMPDLNWRVVMGTGITALVTAYGGSLLPRSGSTGLATQVNDLRSDGVSRSQMVVLSEDDAAAALAGEIGSLTPSGKRKLLTRLEASLSKDAA